ncbi:universal stress protein [Actinoplanes sp. NPDC049802]|uniref:universal stress protein n=1 Tax=Actinoplanes sp. NPDC049802 TaxID=3154742 RepID=UPI0033D5BCBD
MLTPAVVVGTDGTEPATAAVRWAALEAGRRRLPLRIVYVLDWDWSVSRYDYQGDHFDVSRRLAGMVAEEALRRAGDIAPGVDAGFQVPVGHPVTHLLHLSETAELLVLGSRGRGGFAGLMLGSVSQRLAMHAKCPVVVVRGRADAATGPVAVGAEAGETADAVLEAGFAAAADRGAGLVAVRSYVPAVAPPIGRIPPSEIRTPEQDAAERGRLAVQLAPWRAKYPDVRVETLVSPDSAASVLVEVSHGTQLLVIGSHGHGLIAGAVLGSTGMQLLHHADCPVLVVRRGPNGRTS